MGPGGRIIAEPVANRFSSLAFKRLSFKAFRATSRVWVPENSEPCIDMMQGLPLRLLVSWFLCLACPGFVTVVLAVG